ncbi:MAG TPA: flavodoxin family protein [Xanthobacteraceae bacterium]|nr:flavodoxin family protein [Xanthobacteraceae bacterium]
MSQSTAIVYHSANGFTNKVARNIYAGVASKNNNKCRLLNVEFLTKDDWDYIHAASGLIFGAPTYFGGVSGQFKRFMDQTIDIWAEGGWRGKRASAFVTAGDIRFDAHGSLNQLFVFASQHGMQWFNPLSSISQSSAADSGRVVVSYGIAVCGTRNQIEIVLSKQEMGLLSDFGAEFVAERTAEEPKQVRYKA